jgi:hypothetical protein
VFLSKCNIVLPGNGSNEASKHAPFAGYVFVPNGQDRCENSRDISGPCGLLFAEHRPAGMPVRMLQIMRLLFQGRALRAVGTHRRYWSAIRERS